MEGLDKFSYDISNASLGVRVDTAQLSHFDLDAERETVYYGYSSRSAHLLCAAKCSESSSSEKYSSTEIVWPLSSEISTVNVCSSSGMLVVTTLGSYSPPEILISQLAPEREGDGVATHRVQRNVQLNSNTTLWTSALTSKVPGTSPSNFSETLAIGTSLGLLSIKYNQSDFDLQRPAAFKNQELLSMDWISQQTLATGNRRGTVHLWDIRSSGSSVAIQHPFTITGIRRTDNPNHILVAGLRRSMALYDIRMRLKEDDSSPPSFPPRVSIPLLRFDHGNMDFTPLGLDVHQSLGLVATSDNECTVSVQSLRTGKVVKSFENRNTNQTNSRVRCVRFSEDECGRPMLMACMDSRFIEYRW